MTQYASDKFFDLIEDIAADTSRTGKTQRLMVASIDDSDFIKKVLTYAYNPFYVYGYKDLPSPNAEDGGREFNDETWNLLDKLRHGQLTGTNGYATIANELAELTYKSGELLCRIIRKDLRAGFSESTINKVIPGLLPDFPYMRCSLPDKSNMEKWDWSAGIISQEKADGMFVNVNHYDNGGVSLHSRQGTPFPLDEFEDVVAFVKANLPCGHQFHGELLVQSFGKILPREQSNGQLNAVAQGGALEPHCDILLVLWDMIPMTAVKTKGKFDVGYAKRLAALTVALKNASSPSPCVRLIPTRIVKSKVAAFEHYRELLRSGKEGTIVKALDAIWKDGTSKDQVKLKLEVDVELEVVDFIEGEGKYVGTLGALVMQSKCGELRVNVNGRTDAMRDEVWSNKLDYLGSIWTIRANAVMNPSDSSPLHSLFLPRVIEHRTDKIEADTLEQIKDQFANAVESV